MSILLIEQDKKTIKFFYPCAYQENRKKNIYWIPTTKFLEMFLFNCPKSNPNFHDLTWNVVENMIWTIPRSITFSPLHFILYGRKWISFGTVCLPKAGGWSWLRWTSVRQRVSRIWRLQVNCWCGPAHALIYIAFATSYDPPPPPPHLLRVFLRIDRLVKFSSSLKQLLLCSGGGGDAWHTTLE